MFGSNNVGPACSREGRAGEAGKRVAEVDSTYVGGPPKADGRDARGQQSAVGRRASVHTEPWSQVGSTGETPSTTTGVVPSTSSTSYSFSCELLSNLVLTVNNVSSYDPQVQGRL
jgi:hypothetical protein